MFNEANTVEQMILDACQGIGWQFVPGPLRCVRAEQNSCPRMARIDANEESPKPVLCFSFALIRAIRGQTNTVKQTILDACQGLGRQFMPGPLRCVQAEQSSCRRMARIDANKESPKPVLCFSFPLIRAIRGQTPTARQVARCEGWEGRTLVRSQANGKEEICK
jgi:hypothetical protein